MTMRTLGLEDLIRLIDDLRLAGYGVGTRQYVDAQRLLIALAAHGRHPQRPRDLCPHLAPVLCSTPKEQEDFYKFFPLWLSRQPHLREDFDQPPRPEPGAGVKSSGGRKWCWLNARPLLVVAAITVLLLTYPSAIRLDGALTRRISGVVVRQGDNAAVPGAVVAFRRQADVSGPPHYSLATNAQGSFAFDYRVWHTPASLTVTHEDYDARTHPLDASSGAGPVVITLTPAASKPAQPPGERQEGRTDNNQAATPGQVPPSIPTAATTDASDAQIFYRRLRLTALILPLLFFAAWWLKRLYGRRRLLLRRARSAQLPRLEQVTVKGVAHQLFQGQSFRRIVQELRRHRPRDSRDLDEQTTIEATIRRGGLFTPFYGSRRTLPEYLVLIDRVGPGDQLARFQEELIRRLSQDSLNLDTYYFRGDPRICRRMMDDATRPAAYLTLPDLAALHPDYYLLIFSDGSGLIDPVTGKPERWLEQFTPWAGRAVMTPESPSLWRFREWTLHESDFLILPAGRDGLEALGEAVDERAQGDLVDHHPRTLRHFPEMLRDWPRRWLEDHDPPPKQVERLIEQLGIYLGPDGMNWLAACAVYPALSWDITLYLGFELFPRREEFERTLLSLVSLPWLRHGVMPDWLRTALISSLPPPDERAVRRALENLLVSALDAPPDGVRLDYSTLQLEAAAGGWRGLRRRLRERLRAWKRRITLRKFIGVAPDESPLHDVVFLTFLSGRRPRSIDLNVPDVLRHILFRGGFEAFGPRPAAVLACALLFSLAGWATVKSLDPSQRSELVPRAATEPRPTSVVREGYRLKDSLLSLDEWPTLRLDFSIESADAVPFRALRASDLGVTIDGRPVAVLDGDLQIRETEPAGVLILLDDTGSMTGSMVRGINKFSAAKQAILAFIDGLGPKDVVSVATFGDSTNMVVLPTSDKRLLRYSVDKLVTRASPSTRLYDAVEYGLGQARSNKLRNIVIISDGLDESDETHRLDGTALREYRRKREQRIAALSREDGVRIFTIAVGNERGGVLENVDRVSLSNISVGSNGGTSVYIELPESGSRAGDNQMRFEELLSDRLSQSLENIRQSIHQSYSLNIRPGQMLESDGEEHTLRITFSVGRPPTLLVAEYPFRETPPAALNVNSLTRPTPGPFLNVPSSITRAELAIIYVGASAVIAALALFPLLTRRASRGGRHPFATTQTARSQPGPGGKRGSWMGWFSGRTYVLATLFVTALVAAVSLSVLFEKWQQGLRISEGPGQVLERPSESGTPGNRSVPPGMVYVPGGDFIMGRDDGDDYERPAHRVTVKPFFIDAYEVMCEEYRAFIQATGHAAPRYWVNGTYPEGSARKPVTGVNWEDASAYAAWAGKRLPTEAEWEFAARGTDGRLYPWGNEWGVGMANADSASNGVAEVGSYKGASPFGAYDMVGNAWEWTASPLKAYPGGSLPREGGDDLRVIRGGMWLSNRSANATTTYRRGYPEKAAVDYSSSGFRLAKDVE